MSAVVLFSPSLLQSSALPEFGAELSTRTGSATYAPRALAEFAGGVGCRGVPELKLTDAVPIIELGRCLTRSLGYYAEKPPRVVRAWTQRLSNAPPFRCTGVNL